MDMSKLNKDMPAQRRERLQWQLDVIRENQLDVANILVYLLNDHPYAAMDRLGEMHKNDRDAILQPNGILTDQQIELLK